MICLIQLEDLGGRAVLANQRTDGSFVIGGNSLPDHCHIELLVPAGGHHFALICSGDNSMPRLFQDQLARPQKGLVYASTKNQRHRVNFLG